MNNFEVIVKDLYKEESHTYQFQDREDALTFCSVWEKDRYEAKAYEVMRRKIGSHFEGESV